MTTTDSPDRTSLLADLESRQDEVIARLDELNERIERLLREQLGGALPNQESGGWNRTGTGAFATAGDHTGS